MVCYRLDELFLLMSVGNIGLILAPTIGWFYYIEYDADLEDLIKSNAWSIRRLDQIEGVIKIEDLIKSKQWSREEDDLLKAINMCWNWDPVLTSFLSQTINEL